MLAELIERLEKATEASYSLDLAIEIAVGRRKETFNEDDDARAYFAPVPEYTRSLDAAMTLVPERGKDGLYWRCILERKPVHTGPAWIAEIREHAQDGGYAIAPTAALAVCIAALKARASQTTKEGRS